MLAHGLDPLDTRNSQSPATERRRALDERDPGRELVPVKTGKPSSPWECLRRARPGCRAARMFIVGDGSSSRNRGRDALYYHQKAPELLVFCV
jgi:hypothetical protein